MPKMPDKPNSASTLLRDIEALKHSKVKNLVDARIRQFKQMGKKPSKELWKELCFCILCANYTAEGSIRAQKAIGDGFLNIVENRLAQKLRVLGYRFPNVRARYIVAARKHMDSLKVVIVSFGDEAYLREWLVKNVKGIGFKEASHFLRNIGYSNLAILDFHIINVLVKHGLIEKPKTLTKKRYLELEMLLRDIAEKASLTLAELDLFLWYMETGKILK
jgi:N-glycosylase/DNA lyase